MAVVYVAGKYTGTTMEDVQANIDAAEEAGKRLLAMGHVPIIPHKISGHWEHDPRFKDWTPEEWLNWYCLPLLEKCDMVILLPGWDGSKGALVEFQHATAIGMRTLQLKDVVK